MVRCPTDLCRGACMQVDLACKILDGGPFREDPNKVITVQPAKFEMHGETYVPKKKKAKKKKKVVQEDKVLGWGGFDDILPPTQVQPLHVLNKCMNGLSRCMAAHMFLGSCPY